MPNIQDWISQRLKRITYQEFVRETSHRVFKPKKNLQFTQEYYSVPLAGGCGSAIFIAPKSEANETAYGPLVILLHGLGYDSTTPFWHLIYELVADGISVLSLDWDGHGVGASSLFDIQESTRTIPLIIQRLYGEEGGCGLNEKRGGPSCFLMGHSFGASLALIAVTREDVSKYVSGVIAVSPALSVQSFINSSFEFFSFINPFAWFTDFANKLGFYGFWGLLPAYGSFKRSKFPIRMKLDIDYNEQARQFTEETFEKRRILNKVKAPVLWLHGMKDNICPYYKACQLMLEIRSAFFSFCDGERGHIRMLFSDQVTMSSINFIKNNIHNYKLNDKLINEGNHE